jgi:hypothetical protein
MSGLIMLFMSYTIDHDLSLAPIPAASAASSSSRVPPVFPVTYMTFMFCFLTFLSATQDIAVDGIDLDSMSSRLVFFELISSTV